MNPKNDNSNKVGALHSPWRRWGARFLLAGLVLVLSIIVLWQTAYWVRQFAVADLREQKAHTLNLVVENLRGSLSKFQYQPSLLAKNAMFRAVLSSGNVPFVIKTINLEL